jgi:transposase InsO family protein
LSASGPQAAPYPSESESLLRDEFGAVADLVRNEGLELTVLDARRNGVTRPLMAAGLSTTNGACLVFYNPRPAEILMPFFERMAEADLPLWLRVIAVHEITHCIE